VIRRARIAAIAISSLLPGAICAYAAGQPPAQPTVHQYIKSSVSPFSVLRAAAGAAVTQATNTPHEWGQGAAGFGRRLASAFGKHLVKKAIQYPVARLTHEALGYQRSDQTEFKLRLRHALIATVYTTKTTTGKKTVSTSEIAGAFGSGLISRLWQPASVRTVGYGFLSGGITLGVDAGSNVLREFWPDIRRKLHRPDASGNAEPDALQRPELSVVPSAKP
jgi:hypothetical protein